MIKKILKCLRLNNNDNKKTDEDKDTDDDLIIEALTDQLNEVFTKKLVFLIIIVLAFGRR